jgi:hypothetical protein
MPRLYQQLLTGVASYEALGKRIISQIKAAHAFRQVEQVRELASILINIPIKEYQLIGQYYLVWCKCRSFQYDASFLETIAGQIQTYKTQVLLSRGTFEAYQGKPEPALYFYSEALKASRTVSDYVGSSLAIAVVKSMEGFHKSALIDLENLVPIIRHTEPRLYYDFLNSYAVELGEAGRKEEARNVSRVVLASPFTFAYPEWQDTANELKEPNRSIVVIGPSKFVPNNVLPMPTSEHVEIEQTSYNQPAKVFNLQRLRKKMAKGKKGKKDNGEKVFDENVDEMDDKDLLATLIQLAASDDADEEKLRKIVKYAMKVMSEPYKPEPDDSDGA